MTSAGPYLPCPHCRRGLEADSWHDAGSGKCRVCYADFEFVGFPAAVPRPKRVWARAKSAVAEETVCFFHLQNVADTICAECGRLVCTVCSITVSERVVCPSCVAVPGKADAPAAVRERMLYDSTALGIALLPLLIWPVTLLTAPFALGFTIHGWKKPSSLVRGRSRGRLIAAGIFAIVEIGVWVTLGVFWLVKR